MTPARLLLVDDHEVVRQGLRDIVARDPGLQVAGEAADGEQAQALAQQQAADLMVLDIALPRRRGLQVLQSLRSGGITLPVLVFTMLPAVPYADAARRAGAQGYVGKDAGSPHLLSAIHRLLAGGEHFPARGTARGDASRPAPLSPREREVMQGLVAGRSLCEIAQQLGVGATSVTTYRRRLFDKLGVSSNAGLVSWALRHGEA